MMRYGAMLMAALAGLGLASAASAANVIITEIMYHPSSEEVREEYIELYNVAATNVDLAGWRFSRGIQFAFTNTTVLAPGAYLVVAADEERFKSKYPSINNVVGNWAGILSNSRQDIDLDDAFGNRADSVEYADEGDWAIRRRGDLDRNHRGWAWLKEHDGYGKSLELINPLLSNNYGQNWASSSATNGTPGRVNSVFRTNIPPMILEPAHLPAIPKSTDAVLVTARMVDERTNNVTATLHWRLDAVTPPPFTALPMFDDGLHEDGAPGDGIFGATIPPQANNAIVELYLEARDQEGNGRTWPGPTVDTDGTVLGQRANLLYQVDDTTYASSAPLYKLIMTEVERAELDGIGHASNGEQNSDAQMNGAFVGMDNGGRQVRYQIGIKNRGHGSRNRQPNNYRVNFTSDRPWKDVVALNLNGQYSHAQHVGAVLSQKSGIAGADARAVQVRVNNANLANNGPQTYGGMYVANEVLNSEWAEHWFPADDGGNLYRALRDIAPSDFAYRGEDKNAYTNTWYKQTNDSEDDWTDLIGMLRVFGTNDLFTATNVRQVVNVEQWMLHLAVMAMFNNQETGLNSSYNDDYVLYCGVNDPRFILLFYDLDTILGEGSVSGATNYTIFGATGPGLPAFNRFMHWPEFEPIYYRTLQRLIDTTFSQAEFDATVEQTLGDYVPPSVISRMKTWMNGRRAYVQTQIAPFVPPATNAPVAAIFGEPRSPTPLRTATLTVGGAGVTHYRYKLNNGAFGAETPAGTPIQLSGLPNGGTNTVYVIGRNAAGSWQNDTNATASRTWVVNTSWPAVRINEVLARNVSAVNHNGTFPDLIELYNEGSGTVDLSGMRVTDNPENPNKYVFPNPTTLTAGAYLVLYANNNDGTPGIHLGFSLNQDGEGVYLFQRATDGGASLDSVVFGLQLPDRSIGRLAGGEFALTQPTFGAANVAQPTENFRTLRINEWLTDTLSLFPTDFVEVYNPAPLPVALGGLFLTDNPIGAPRRHEITALSFIAANGYTSFKADSDPNQGADHLNFNLAVEQGLVALLAPDETVINCVSYGPQRTDVSQGRSPNGSDTLSFFLQPTPGAANPLASANVTTQTVSLLFMTNVWKYNQTANLDGVNWTNPSFNDSSWPSGAAVLYRDPDPIPVPTNTLLTLGRNTYYFRAHFNYGGDPASAVLMLSLVVDDGAVFYLNGQRLFSIGMPTNGPIAYATNATRNVNNADIEGPFIASATNLRVGDNVLAAEVHQIGSSSQDIAFGLALNAVITVTNLSSMPVVLGEVLANNQSIANASGVTADYIELFNPGNNAIDLGDMSLSDELGAPRKWVFPANTVIATGGFIVVSFDDNAPASASNTGFGLSSGGDAVYFFQNPAAGGALVDSVTFGLQAADFSIGRDANAGGPWRLSLPTPGTANVAAGLGNPAALRINEWMANPTDGDDWFEIYNPNLQPVDLNGLALTDDLTDRDKSPIPALSFIGTGDSGFARFIADGSTGNGADHVGFGLLSAGDQIGLFTAVGSQIDAVNFGVQAPGVSQGRFPDGSGATANFTTTSSPGESNFLPLPNVVINEVLSHTDLPLEDAIEFYNPTAADANIGGWFLSNTGGNLRKFRVPGGTVVPARGFAVIYEKQFGTNMGPGSIVPFTFNSAHGDQAYLSQADGSGNLTGYRASAKFGAATNGVSFGRYTNSVGQVDYVAMSALSFGVNNPSTVDQFRAGTGAANPYPLVGPVVINEIMYHPPSVDGLEDNTQDEFLELYNLSANTVTLFDPAAPTNTWKLTGGVDYTFPQNISLQRGGFLLLVNFDPAADPVASAEFRARYNLSASVPLFGPYSGKLSNTGESIGLYKPDPPQAPPHPDAGFVPYVLVEHIDYLNLAPWPAGASGTGSSLQRQGPSSYGNDPANWFVAAPTALAANTTTAFDADADGLPDAWELQYFPSISDPRSTPNGDPDGDGFTNLQEYVAGTSPMDGASRLKIDAVALTGSAPAIQFNAVAGKTYSIFYRDNLTTGVWVKWTDVPAQASTGMVTVNDPGAGGASVRFYRLVTPAQP